MGSTIPEAPRPDNAGGSARGAAHQVDERGAAPQVERVTQQPCRRLGVTRVEGGAPFRREPVETGRVERITRKIERVAASARRDPILAQRTS